MQFRDVAKGALFLAGLIIGVGFFGLPYVAKEAGFFVTAGFLLLATFLVTLIHLAYAEIVLRTKGEHGFIGYAERYLGGEGKTVALISGIGGLVGSLLAYLLLGGQFLHILIPSVSSPAWVIILSLTIFVLLSKGLRSSSRVEIVMTIFLIGALLGISLISLPFLDSGNLFLGSHALFFAPYGIALFSLIGSSAIPDVVKLLGVGARRNLSAAIVVGTLVPGLLYLFFTFAVVGATGPLTTPEAVVGLGQLFGPAILQFGALIGILAVFTSHLLIGLYTQRVLTFDLKFRPTAASLMVVGAPLVLYAFGIRSFLFIISLVGAVGLGMDGILTFLILWQAKKMGDQEPPHPLRIPLWGMLLLCLLFSVGALAELAKILRR